jgi:ATP-dependent exoDNAse (exonuclease V) beta subunit
MSERFIDKTKWGDTLRTDKWVDEELGVAGTPDQVFIQDDKYVLLDTKTTSQDSARYIAPISDEEYWLTKGSRYRLQLGTYLVMAKRRYEIGLEKYKIDYQTSFYLFYHLLKHLAV